MKILILNWRDIKHPLSGGAEISLFEHAKYWKNKGAKVIWFSSAFLNSKKEEEIEGIKILRRGSHYSVHFFAFINFIFGKLGKPDIIVDSFHFLPFFSPLYVGKIKVIGLINEVAGKVWFSNIFFPLSLIGYLIEPLFFNFYKNKKFITSSLSTKKELLKLGIVEENIRIVLHGATIERVRESVLKEKDPTVVYLGRISKDKGIQDALMGFKIMLEKIPNLQIWIIGKEEEKGYLNKLLSDKKFNSISNLKYYNYVTQAKKFELLKRAWILVHPSRKEGWGLNVIEAASQGTPTVGYNREGLRDSIVNRKTGLLTPPDPKSLSESVIELIQNKNLYNELSGGSLIWSKKFNWEKSNRESWSVLIN